jgi:hypothetical protein
MWNLSRSALMWSVPWGFPGRQCTWWQVLRGRLLTIRTQVDYSERMLACARKRVVELEREDLCGFIFKSGSPSSGKERVKIYYLRLCGSLGYPYPKMFFGASLPE